MIRVQLFAAALVALTLSSAPEAASSTIDLDLEAVVKQSECRKLDPANSKNQDLAPFKWGNRGRPPAGYLEGVARTYAKSYCDLKAGASYSKTVAGPLSSKTDSKKRPLDALTWLQIPAGTDVERLRATYALAISLGMRESSGNTTEGRDATADAAPTSDNAEAGLYQVSYDSFDGSPLFETLWSEYRSAPQHCLLDTFRKGVIDKNMPIVGSDNGAAFQKFTKECPGFATEYVALMLRTQATHFGPLRAKNPNDTKARHFPACDSLLLTVQTATRC